MTLSFGTSGLRGLVTELDDETVRGWARAFLVACPPQGALFVGRDLRASSPRISKALMAEFAAAGIEVVDCGVVPTPALALAAVGASAAMVTGSHIPADRNGLKFYVASGEISKADEARMSAANAAGARPKPAAARAIHRPLDTLAAYRARYLDAFGPQALAGLRLGVWQHSSAARDVLAGVLAGIGAEVVELGRCEQFVPVDTEAVDAATKAMLDEWCTAKKLDALVSTDGDGDRPLLADASGTVVPGDVLGVLTARALEASVVVTPVSSNSMVAKLFADTRLTRIGSPFVVAQMESVRSADPASRVVGFEANGGFVLGFEARGPAGPIAPLMTRDALLPLIAPLALARANDAPIAALVAALPARFTATDRLQGIDMARAARFLAGLDGSAERRARFLGSFGTEVGLDQTDGLRMTLDSGDILHLRPSGNAPEFRVYCEASSRETSRALLNAALERVEREIKEQDP